jgi:AraC family transcriptional regulator, regulatory protein of adaptative response / methylated-DNA-[protein]-cysteine methyltransferase
METSGLTPRPGSMHAITYSYGESSLGSFLAAIDEEGVCAVLGDDRDELRCDLQAKFPDRNLEIAAHMGFGDTIIDAVASLIEQPASVPVFAMSIRAGDFEQMLYAALRQTKPGTTVTPAEIAVMIGGAPGSAPFVRAHASRDHLAVVVPFHRLQELDGTSPAYRWGEERRAALLKREAAWPVLIAG